MISYPRPISGDLPLNSLWLILTSLAAFLVAYRLYGAFLAAKVAVLNDARSTPAHRLKDGVDYHPTHRLVLFGVHFAAIAGPGPLVGPVLAAQWGWLPGFSWIIIGACLGGGIHDFVILLASVRSNGLSLPQIARQNIGPVAGLVSSIAAMFIIVMVLASVAIVVVNALAESSWGMFTILTTIPAALVTGLWMRFRKGKVGEASIIGISLVMLGVILGRPFAESSLAPYLLFSRPTLSILLPAYAFVASSLPVWVLMVPRDYLSSYMKIGVMLILGVGIVIAAPILKMPATTPFLHGGGPIVSGAVWPFVCIVIMCGALSGFHALIASGTTPKMLDKETDIRAIGYGTMVLEGFVAVTALVAACALEPGDYFAINIAHQTEARIAAANPAAQPALRAEVTKYNTFVANTSATGWDVAPHELTTLETQMDEKLAGRSGGAVTLAVGMSKIFTRLPGMSTLASYWYHFVIMFEALFILTLLETGTRVTRFIFQEFLAQFRPSETRPSGSVDRRAPSASPTTSPTDLSRRAPAPIETLLNTPAHKPSWLANISFSAITCLLWGYLLYTGNLDTLWRMLGIANQLLATIALAVGTTYLLNHAPKKRYALLSGIPFIFTIVTVFAASYLSIQGWWSQAATAPTALAFQLKLLCILAATMMALTAIIAADALRRWYVILLGEVAQPAPAV